MKINKKSHVALSITVESNSEESVIKIRTAKTVYTRDLFKKSFGKEEKECFNFNGVLYSCERNQNIITKITFEKVYHKNGIDTLTLLESTSDNQNSDNQNSDNGIQIDDDIFNSLTNTIAKPEPIPVKETINKWEKPIKHEKYKQIEKCIKNNIPVYLSGPAGSGKNHVLEQIAGGLNMNFYFSNSVQQEYKLTGFIDAGGKYHETEFYKAATCEDECIFFLDEMDASIPEVLVLMNAAIANGYFEFPTGRLEINHIHFVAAGNTIGSGSDEKYTGRMVIDQATLDRFAIILFDYDRNIELYLTKGNEELVDFIRSLRQESDRGMIRTTFSYRCLSMVMKLEKAEMELTDIILITVVKGLDKDIIRTLNPTGDNKYTKAFRELRRVA